MSSTADILNQNVEEAELLRSKALFNCLEPLLKALNWTGKKQHLIEALPHYANVINLIDFIKIMETLRYSTKSLKIPLKKLDGRLAPCFYVTNAGEYWVILKKNKNEVVVFTSSDQQQKTLFNPKTKGKAYFFSYNPVDEISGAGKEDWFRKIISKYTAIAFAVFVLTMIVSLFAFGLPIFSISVYDLVIPADSVSMLLYFIGGIGIILIANGCIQYINSTLLIYVGTKINTKMSNTIFERLLYLPTLYLENSAVGSQVERIKDFDNIRDLFTAQLINLFFELPFIILFLIGIMVLGGMLVLVPVIGVVIFLITIYILSPKLAQYVKETAREGSKRHALLLETLFNIRAIKLTVSEDTWFKRYRELSLNWLSKNSKAQIFTAFINSFADLLIYIVAIFILGIGADEVIKGKMTTGMLIAVVMLSWRVLMPLKTLFSSQMRLRQIHASIQQVNALMSVPPERASGMLSEPIQNLKGKIVFNRVTFRYPNALESTLLGVSFLIEPGELVVVVGRNGAGKSSLLNLILSLYKPTTGTILIENQDIRQFDPIELRKSMGYIPQTCHIFYGTIAQNICIVKTTATVEEMYKAAEQADFLEEVKKLPDGFDTQLGDQANSKFSPSFLKRLMLARTYLKDPSIILMDEPTLDLDQKGSDAFLKAIEHFRKRATILLVTHRPSHFKFANKIILLHEGQVLLSGTAEQVLPKLPQEFLK